ncbi:helix-turn-helix domain-containing GNAT family N-acetyltransferase [Plantactinospora sp. KLBMP9567]|uniref:bifunctional helix-turn-helix transcriptional regulator/GNAT family N-acetyltransferase n=1 Tax=Plantactinospora sp. KLBMP9567 TaxID=3085900 RepID=UPI0029814401|nr:helix-turn-helix domain-containing GNAT family N-acetyltransferase [Plantactinospora sp. KLBMP9567]MDW5325107.1 helix-turn-helix domain-containing GNAT family N-acetyltransferase [Plantactinospora sp. KLBMP9567]MDW5329308.1 helix-turn-helix domain-containing GNAT family N-acetyltransferase [Plantactinospora sp. KLBMP9567]
MASPLTPQASAVRDFNRFYTRIIGVLDEGMVHTPFSLTDGRVIYELAQRPATEVPTLRRELGLDPGYLSRILSRFAADGLVERSQSPVDARRQVVTLTEAGRAAYDLLNQRTQTEIEGLLTRLPAADRERLVEAMRTIRGVLGEATPPRAYLLRPVRPGDLGWVVHRHGVRYAEEYGWDITCEALAARIVAEYVEGRDPRREEAWIAELDGAPVGCVFCVRRDDEVAQLRLLLVEPEARGLGIGTRLVDECLRFARRAGYREIMLWTNDVLADARRIYEKAGFELREQAPHHSFGHDLVEQTWWRRL